MLAVYLAANNEKLPEALSFAQKAVSSQPGSANLQLALAQVLVRMRRYDDAETLGRRVLARAADDGIRGEANSVLTYVTQARDYDARMRQMQEESAARAKALATAVPADQVAARSEQVSVHSEEVPAEQVSQPTGSSSDPNAPVLKRRDGSNEVLGVVIQVSCNGNEMEVMMRVGDRPAPSVFRAKDRTRIGYTSNSPAIHRDIEPCSELKGHTAKLSFTPSEAKWLDGEVVQIVVEK